MNFFLESFSNPQNDFNRLSIKRLEISGSWIPEDLLIVVGIDAFFLVMDSGFFDLVDITADVDKLEMDWKFVTDDGNLFVVWFKAVCAIVGALPSFEVESIDVILDFSLSVVEWPLAPVVPLSVIFDVSAVTLNWAVAPLVPLSVIFGVSVAALDCALVSLVPLSVFFDVSAAMLDCVLVPIVPFSVIFNVSIVSCNWAVAPFVPLSVILDVSAAILECGLETLVPLSVIFDVSAVTFDLILFVIVFIEEDKLWIEVLIDDKWKSTRM